MTNKSLPSSIQQQQQPNVELHDLVICQYCHVIYNLSTVSSPCYHTIEKYYLNNNNNNNNDNNQQQQHQQQNIVEVDSNNNIVVDNVQLSNNTIQQMMNNITTPFTQ
eukprot:UN08899